MSDQDTDMHQPSAGTPAASAPAKQKSDSPADGAAASAKTGEKGLGTVLIRNEFYRDGYRLMQKISLIQAFIIVGLIFIMFVVVKTNEQQYAYFATTEDGRLVPMVPLSEPNLSTPALTSWAAQAATEVMTFGFHDYKKRLQESSRNFTRRGWASFTTALDKSRVLETVQTYQQVVTATPTSAPVIIQEGIVNGRYQWVLELPLTVTYQAGSQRRSDNLRVNLVVVRVPKLESPNGVGIEQWLAAYN